MIKLRCDFEVLDNPLSDALIICDLDIGGMSVTNDAENVVATLRDSGFLEPNQRLFYYDSDDVLGEIVWRQNGEIYTVEFKSFDDEIDSSMKKLMFNNEEIPISAERADEKMEEFVGKLISNYIHKN